MTEAALILSICAVAMALVAIARSGGGRSGSAELTEVRLSRAERRLQEMASFVGLPPEAVPPPVPAGPASSAWSGAGGQLSQAVLDYLQAGLKIQAIKQYRMETHVGLKEAKDAIDAAEAAGAANPEFKINA